MPNETATQLSPEELALLQSPTEESKAAAPTLSPEELQILNAPVEQALPPQVAPTTELSAEEKAFLSAPVEASPESVTKTASKYERQNAVFGDLITQNEINELSVKHNLGPSADLASYVEFLGGNKESEGVFNNIVDPIKSVAGQLQKSVGMGIPSLYMIESQKDEGLKRALYELRELADQKQGVMATIGQGAASALSAIRLAGVVGPALGVTSKLGMAALEVSSNITGGAVAGFAGSNERENAVHEGLEGAAFGAAVSALPILTKGAVGGVRAIKRVLQKASPLEGKVMQVIEKEAARIDARTGTAQRLLSEGNFKDVYDAHELQSITDPAVLNKEVTEYMQGLSDVGRAELSQQMRDAGVQAAAENKFIFQRKVTQDITDFASSVAGREITSPGIAKEVLQAHVAREGLVSLGQQFEHHLERLAADQLIEKGLIKVLPEQAGAIKRMYDGVKDARYAYEAIDRRIGTSTVPLIDNLSQAGNKFGEQMRKVLPEIQAAITETKKTNLTNANIFEYLDKGTRLDEIPTSYRTSVNSWRNFFESQRLRANDLGLPITSFKTIEGVPAYVPHARVFGTELVDRLTAQVTKINAEVGIDILSQAPLSAEKGILLFKDSAAYKMLRESIAYMKGGSIGPEGTPGAIGLKEVQDTLKNIMKGTPVERDLVRRGNAAAAFARDLEEVPSLIRNTDIVQLATGWANNTYKHIYFREGIDSLAKYRDVALKVGDTRAAEYINKHLIDLVSPSVRDTIANSANALRTQSYVALSAKAAKGSKSAQIMSSLLSDNNDLLSLAANQVYPNFLGFSVRATLQNLAQPLTMTVPELGYKYGTAKYLQAIKGMVTGKAPALDILKEKGYMQESFTPELQAVLRGSIEKSGTSLPRKVIDKYNDIAMFMYSKAEIINRKSIATMAASVAEDFMAKNPSAINFVRQMDDGSRRRIYDAIKIGDATVVEDTMTKFMLGKTALNYDKASLSEFGRSVGPVLSAFTKWPSSMLGEALINMERKGVAPGVLKTFVKYGIPYLSLKGVNNLLTEEDVISPEKTGASQVFLGKKGLQGLSPAGNFENIIKGQLTPPVLGMPAKIASGLPGIDQAMSSFLPFGSGFRILDDIMQITDGTHFGKTPLRALQENGIIDKPKGGNN